MSRTTKKYWLEKIQNKAGVRLNSTSELRLYLKKIWGESPLCLGSVQDIENIAYHLGVEEACYREVLMHVGKIPKYNYKDLLAYYKAVKSQRKTAKAFNLGKPRVREIIRACLPWEGDEQYPFE